MKNHHQNPYNLSKTQNPMAKKPLSKALEKRLDRLEEDETLVVKINTNDLDGVEEHLKFFIMNYTVVPDCTGYFAVLTASQIRYFAKHSPVESIRDDLHY